jgi:hypothetical protein
MTIGNSHLTLTDEGIKGMSATVKVLNALMTMCKNNSVDIFFENEENEAISYFELCHAKYVLENLLKMELVFP